MGRRKRKDPYFTDVTLACDDGEGKNNQEKTVQLYFTDVTLVCDDGESKNNRHFLPNYIHSGTFQEESKTETQVLQQHFFILNANGLWLQFQDVPHI